MCPAESWAQMGTGQFDLGRGESQKPPWRGGACRSQRQTRGRRTPRLRQRLWRGTHGKQVLQQQGGERSGHPEPGGEGRLVPSCFHVLPLYLVLGSGLNHFHVFSQFPEENRTRREVNCPRLHSQTWPRWNLNPFLAAASMFPLPRTFPQGDWPRDLDQVVGREKVRN